MTVSLFDYLTRVLNSEARAGEHLTAGHVRVDGVVARDPATVLAAGRKVTLLATDDEGDAAIARAAAAPRPPARSGRPGGLFTEGRR